MLASAKWGLEEGRRKGEEREEKKLGTSLRLSPKPRSSNLKPLVAPALWLCVCRPRRVWNAAKVERRREHAWPSLGLGTVGLGGKGGDLSCGEGAGMGQGLKSGGGKGARPARVGSEGLDPVLVVKLSVHLGGEALLHLGGEALLHLRSWSSHLGHRGSTLVVGLRVPGFGPSHPAHSLSLRLSLSLLCLCSGVVRTGVVSFLVLPVRARWRRGPRQCGLHASSGWTSTPSKFERGENTFFFSPFFLLPFSALPGLLWQEALLCDQNNEDPKLEALNPRTGTALLLDFSFLISHGVRFLVGHVQPRRSG